MSTEATTPRRAVGIARQSRGDGESVQQQAKRIRDACERDGLELLKIITEQDVSGGTPLEKRRGLREAVEMAEAGEVQVVMGAYFDRLMRSLKVQAELVERVEAAGGSVLALDTGEVTNGTAGQWLSSTLLGAVAEYHRRTTAERVKDAVIEAVMVRGIPPWHGAVPGYVRRDGEPLEPHPEHASVVAEGFRMRAEGASVAEVREHLRAHGIERSFASVPRLLKSRVVLGEIAYGQYINRSAHPAIVDLETWQRVQRMRVSRGRMAKSERLLARLGKLRCGTCGARMVVGNGFNGRYPSYRCPTSSDCPGRMSVSAPVAEEFVTREVLLHLIDAEGQASAELHAREAEAWLERAQAELDALIKLLDPLEPAAAERLETATAKRDEARDQLDRLGGVRATRRVRTASDWGRLTLAERRGLISATVDRIVVSPGRGKDRLSIEFFRQ